MSVWYCSSDDQLIVINWSRGEGVRKTIDLSTYKTRAWIYIGEFD